MSEQRTFSGFVWENPEGFLVRLVGLSGLVPPVLPHSCTVSTASCAVTRCYFSCQNSKLRVETFCAPDAWFENSLIPTMIQAAELVYSRDEVVREVTSFYEFLVRLHIPDSALKIPPPGGWPDIDNERYAWLEKDETVIDLLRHLPFIYREDYGDGHEIYTLTAAVDYNGPYILHCMAKGQSADIDGLDDCPTIPSYVLTLANETCAGDGCWIFINTKRGTVTLYEPLVPPDSGPLGKGTVQNEPAEDDSNQEWRDHSTWRVKEFFDLMKEKFKTFVLMANDEWDVRPTYDSDIDRKCMQIFREYGWLSDDYRKQECLEGVAKAIDDFQHELHLRDQTENLQI